MREMGRNQTALSMINCFQKKRNSWDCISCEFSFPDKLKYMREWKKKVLFEFREHWELLYIQFYIVNKKLFFLLLRYQEQKNNRATFKSNFLKIHLMFILDEQKTLQPQERTLKDVNPWFQFKRSNKNISQQFLITHVQCDTFSFSFKLQLQSSESLQTIATISAR